MRAPIALVIAVLATCVAVAGCASESEGSNGGSSMSGGSMVEHDDQLAATITGMSKRGETRRLAELTNFAWDKVYLYSEGASAKEIAKDVGSDVLSDAYYYSAGNLLVFTRGGEVLSAVSIVPDLLTWDGANAFGAEAKLTPAHPGGQTGLLRVEEPGA